MIKANRFIAVLMVIGMLLQINVVLACYGLYFLNRKAIAEKVCEKKVKHCNGHCFLKKKIAEATDAPASSPEKQNSPKTLDELLGAMPGMLPGKANCEQKIPVLLSYGARHPFFLLDGVKGTIEHPPNS
ncbi:MAG: hypothetical protein HGA26_00290 [Chlorobiaceae bacterium]|nr:hypothetical protein [Chlorobiaceae bacterium]